MPEKLNRISDEEIDSVVGKTSQERYLARHATDWEAKAIAQAQLEADQQQHEQILKVIKQEIEDRFFNPGSMFDIWQQFWQRYLEGK